jgi:surface polysaccharide O-acyltransferase-like enzyme
MAGIEWMRGISAFGVICVHAGIVVHGRITPCVEVLQNGFVFAVPFFLLTSFYWALRTESARALPWGEWFRRRAGRLLVPFVFWSVVYFSLHVVKVLVHHQAGQVPGLLADPGSLILRGGTALALYFLPFLFMGLTLTHLLSGLLLRSSLPVLTAGFGVALALNEYCYRHDYICHLEDNGGNHNVLAWVAVKLIEEAIECGPLVFAAGFLSRYLPPPGARSALLMLMPGLVLTAVMPFVVGPGCAQFLALAAGPFLLAWGWSGLVAADEFALVVGKYSFGVYLVHQVFLELVQALSPPGHTAGVPGILAVAALVYAASMLAVGLAARGGPLARRVFGLK